MADVKISGLPASTVPLAGTEVLPIVQGGTTKQVSIANVTAGRAVAATSITTDTYKAASSSGGALQNSSGTPQLQWGAGGGNNLSVDVAININPANAAVAISPTGTGTVAISPAGALTINPTAASTINNTSIGATTASTGRFTTVTSTIATGTAPLVVASTTEVANLRAANATSADTANQVKSNATTGVLQVVGPAAASTRVMTTPDANFTVARTNTGQTFTGYQTYSASAGTYIHTFISDATGGTVADGLEFVYGDGLAKGGIRWNETITVYNTTSDYRLKTDIAPMTGALARNKRLKPRFYTWATNGLNGEGFVAHELQEEFPNAVIGNKDEIDAEGKPVYQGIGAGPLDGHFSACINELQDLVESQSTLIENLTNRLNALEGK